VSVDNVRMTDTLDHLRPGLPLPSVSLPTTEGTEISLATLPGRSLIIVYPWTGCPGEPDPPNWDNIQGAHGSTPELEGFRDHAAEFAELGVALYALSTQAADYQREMAQRLRLPFPVLSDVAQGFSRALRLPIFTTGSESFLKRLTLLDNEGRIAHVFYPVPEPALHAEDVLSWLRALS
jgi:peroxiredoxin